MKEQINYDTFEKVDIRIGTVISVKKNEKARKPSLVIKVDFGDEIGIKQSSAQITHYYNEENLKGKNKGINSELYLLIEQLADMYQTCTGRKPSVTIGQHKGVIKDSYKQDIKGSFFNLVKAIICIADISDKQGITDNSIVNGIKLDQKS